MASARPDCSVGLNRGNCDLSEDGLFHKMFHVETFGDPPRRWHPTGSFYGPPWCHFRTLHPAFFVLVPGLATIVRGQNRVDPLLREEAPRRPGASRWSDRTRTRNRHKTSVGKSGKRLVPRSSRVRSCQLATPIQAPTAGGQAAAACGPMPLTALFCLVVLRRVSGCEGGPTKVTNLTVIPFRTKPRNLFASGVARKFNSPGVRRTEAGPKESPRVSSTSLPGKLAAANSRRLTLSRGRSASGDGRRLESDRPIEPKAPHFEDRSSSSSIRDWSDHQVCDLLSSSWIFRSSCLCFENTANELPAATPATSAWTRGLAAKARLPVRSFERPAALQKTSPTEQPEHPAGALTASFPAHGRRRRS